MLFLGTVSGGEGIIQLEELWYREIHLVLSQVLMLMQDSSRADINE